MRRNRTKQGHELYTSADFTIEEMERRNQIAVNVVENGMEICKLCGATDDELDSWCSKASFVTPRIGDIAAFMADRHEVYLKRKQGLPGPWTDDPVLREGRFCNIFRELDTVTIWIDKHIRKPYAEHKNLWIMLAIARYINWPGTLEQLLDTKAWPDYDGWEPKYLTEALEAMARKGGKIYTGAYMIRAESDTRKPWYNWSKHRYIAEVVIGRLWDRREEWEEWLTTEPCPGNPGNTLPSLEQVWDKFQEGWYVGWGPFMAYEVVTDMRHTRYCKNAPDIYTWANAGPGAIRGLNRLFGKPLSHQPPKHQTCEEMRVLMEELNHFNRPRFVQIFGKTSEINPRFEMRDIEHTLCEFDKYERVRLGEGKMRSKYDWTKAKPL